MKVLFLSTWFPYPPDNGSRIRAYHLLKALARRHDVYLISLLQEDSDPENAVHLEEICKVWSLHESRWFNPGTFKSFLGFFSSRPRSFVDTFDPSVKQAVREAVLQIQPDAIIVSTIGVAEYVPHDLRVPIVMDHHNCEYAIMKRAAENRAGALARFRYTLGWKKFARWEAAVCRAFDGVAMVSDLDREDMLRAAPDLKNVGVIPNGVDTAHYQPCDRAPEPGVILYNGALTYGANLDAVRYFVSDIYPRLQADLPHLKLMVTGRTAGVDLSGIEDCPGVELTGYVQGMRDVLRGSSACVVPLRHGGGSRLKILEAMAAGVPVVSSSKGAEGIDCTDGDHLLIADEPDDFAAAIKLVLENAELAGRLATTARKLVVDRYDWSTIGEAFTEFVESAVARRNAQ
jgi:glycosyltransferase involved in cell wall biosynthesis